MAYRDPEPTETSALYRIINNAYSMECFGSEAFRQEGDFIQRDQLEDMILSPEYRWIVVEAPGRTRENGDPIILGVCGLTTTGSSKRNGSL